MHRRQRQKVNWYCPKLYISLNKTTKQTLKKPTSKKKTHKGLMLSPWMTITKIKRKKKCFGANGEVERHLVRMYKTLYWAPPPPLSFALSSPTLPEQKEFEKGRGGGGGLVHCFVHSNRKKKKKKRKREKNRSQLWTNSTQSENTKEREKIEISKVSFIENSPNFEYEMCNLPSCRTRPARLRIRWELIRPTRYPQPLTLKV